MNGKVKHVLIVAGIATVTLFVWNFLAKTTIPVVSTVATKVTGG